jgi:glycerol-1-phosphate dehydrogenase [NAD(P)+]
MAPGPDTRLPAPGPDDLPAVKRWLQARPDADQLQPLPIRHIVVAADALIRLPDLLRELDAPSRVLIAQDPTPMRRGQDDLKPLAHDLLASAGRQAESFVFPPDADGQVHADLANAALLASSIRETPTTVVALGSGSVCDLAKHACYLAERQGDARITLVLVPTAASVTAFTSSLAVLLKDGVKRTIPSRFPDAVVCDLETLRHAPRAMTLAGLGDCCARFVSYGDWYLAHQLGMVDRYSETPLALMGEQLDALYLEHAAAVRESESDSLAFLIRQVLLAGLAQSVVNLSAPLSGTEHVVSHVLDMGAATWGRGMALHGAQVGVATLLAARAYELLLERFDPLQPRPAPPDPEFAREAIREAFLPLDRSGQIAEECWRDYSQKLALWTRQEERFDALREEWDSRIAPRLRQLVRPAETVHAILRRAGHPLRFDELHPPIPDWQVRFALANAHLIRQRFTLGDFFAFVGLDGEALVDELMGHAKELEAGHGSPLPVGEG